MRGLLEADRPDDRSRRSAMFVRRSPVENPAGLSARMPTSDLHRRWSPTPRVVATAETYVRPSASRHDTSDPPSELYARLRHTIGTAVLRCSLHAQNNVR